IGLSLTGSCRMEDLSAAGAACLLMGNEQSGLPAMLENACDARARLPMAGAADSLNLAIATGVALYGLWRAQGYEGATR
ncbi:MAG: RNA methyltransferase, partial [Hyphomonadaceae bacterium]|nr:RNA methyltransferase [Hyphomonadaceae bacterium]